MKKPTAQQLEIHQRQQARLERISERIDAAHDTMHRAIDKAKTAAQKQAAIDAFHAAKAAIRSSEPEIPLED